MNEKEAIKLVELFLKHKGKVHKGQARFLIDYGQAKGYLEAIKKTERILKQLKHLKRNIHSMYVTTMKDRINKMIKDWEKEK